MEVHIDIYLIRFHSAYKYILDVHLLQYHIWGVIDAGIFHGHVYFYHEKAMFHDCPIIMGIPLQKMCLIHYVNVC